MQVRLYGIPYEVDLAACRVRFLERVVELGTAPGKGGVSLVAKEAGVSHMTVRRFFDGGRPLTSESFIAVLTRGLGLGLNDVARVALERVA